MLTCQSKNDLDSSRSNLRSYINQNLKFINSSDELNSPFTQHYGIIGQARLARRSVSCGNDEIQALGQLLKAQDIAWSSGDASIMRYRHVGGRKQYLVNSDIH